ncbi:DNA mismatch repair protein MLH3-like isoform X2 [Solanum dulcamara]|uniref:DNA mismatch repair protein MLH3-like isoform X2 n=1 Tax=Solanum dulcamara TaxID=45834 RepID=UPI00248531E8|nr:DNA mismatch repair protein MLH3-like isoform X2 [Solanum dulcamara]
MCRKFCSIYYFTSSPEVVLSFEGYGISRDGLVLMGERYAASKYCYSGDMHAFPASFGLKGEALSSTSDVSLFEIVTKTHGRPIGYCKLLKRKCLHLGIDDCRQDVGTTVIVREVFYNQPVRMKQMHSNEDDLFCTSASPSPLLLLSCGFGIHLSSLNKLNASDGSFKLSGPDVYTVKIPVQDSFLADTCSRFVSKGPRHKLPNNITMSFDSAFDIEQRSRSQIYPLFLLNLNCPISLYDLALLEPSKTSVESKFELISWFLLTQSFLT